MEKESKLQEADYVSEDPWDLPDLDIKTVQWSELTTLGKVKRVLWDYFFRYVCLIGFLYLFICSLDFLSSAFRLLGGRTAGKAFSESELLKNPVAGLMIGVLVTVLVQSSSTSTSIIISMVGAGIINVKEAVFIVMGANIGTTVTNTIVSMGQAGKKDEFRRAFGAATVHDMFNWLVVIVLLPIEAASGYLYELSGLVIRKWNVTTNEGADMELLKKITKPFTSKIIKIDKNVIKDIALNKSVEGRTILKVWCQKEKTEESVLFNSTTGLNQTIQQVIPGERCEALFSQTNLSDSIAGIILLLVALFILCACLVLIVKLLNSILQGTIAKVVRKVINYEFPGAAGYFTGYIAILAGAGLTILVQSSSIFTSTLTPLVGIGVIKLERMYPLTLGSNIGTTATGILAALASDGEALKRSMQLALCHLFFNISGILLYYPIPFMRFPIPLAKGLGNTTAKYRWFALVYLIFMFFLTPALVFGLSYAGWSVLAGVGVPLLLILICIGVVNILQNKIPRVLPRKLRTWEFLPLWMHSLSPLDNLIMNIFGRCHCCDKLTQVDRDSNPVVVVADQLPPSKAHENMAYQNSQQDIHKTAL